MNQTRGSKRSSSPKKNNDISKKRMLDEKENVDTNLQNVSQPRPALQPIQPHSESTVPHIQILRCEESSLNDYHDMFPSPEQQEALSPPLSPSPSSSTPHLLLPEEQQEHLSYFFQNERRFMPTSGDYINEIQREISPNMRAILIGWIIEVCIDMNLSTDTIFHCKNYIDRYLSICHVPRCFLQLLGITCLFVASKLEDITPPTINDLVQVSDEIYQRIQIIELETKLLNVLDFSLVSINEKNFLRRYHLIELPFVRSKEKAERVRFLSNYLLELSLLEYSIIIYPPSIIAAAVFSLSLATFGFSPWVSFKI
eukprot:TRINITY_DN5511_c0_g1_i1.p1 TRINITY_DN5511_c0_g1~~TRINITY_DN5511_c0_g1_i1.p1  ORF type:complete len:323 (+),score=57.34 TRINITY_DN5511_c0_g1_i1:35-970(+)